MKPLNLTETEVRSIVWDRTMTKHRNVFILLCLLMLAVVIVWLLPTEQGAVLHSSLFLIALIAWLYAMYAYFNPKYEKMKKELLDEWNRVNE